MDGKVARLAAAAVSLMVSLPVGAQTLPHRDPQLSRTTISAALARIDSSVDRSTRRTLVGAALGAGGGATLGLGLAWLGHQAFCEGTAQCAMQPTRAYRTSAAVGVAVGGVLGAAIGLASRRSPDPPPSTRQSTER